MKNKKTPRLNHEEIWNKYGKMVMKIAHNFGRKYSKPFDELLSEGMFGVLEKTARAATDVFSGIGGATFTSPLKAIVKPATHFVTDLVSMPSKACRMTRAAV